jgi:BirA family biotin operon repressor/biotin-[acetyl-CoA-carboxylase] ligase
MQRAILKALRRGGCLSGEDLAKSFGVTRAAIWKYIRNLRQKGYHITSSPRLGYRLEQAPDLLTPEEIQTELDTKTFGSSIHYLEEVASTQDEARRLAESGAAEGTLVVAEVQAAGRGRRDRHWISPPRAGIYVSLILRPHLEPFNIAQMPIVAGIGVCESIAEITDLQPRMKWPNDVLVEGKKVAGILAEMSAEPERIHYVILGIGINVNTPVSAFPDNLQPTAISLADASGRLVSRRMLVQALLQKLEALYDQFQRTGFQALRERCRRWDKTIRSLVEIQDASGSFVGYALDIDEDGALLVKDREGFVRRVLAGDATLRQYPGSGVG